MAAPPPKRKATSKVAPKAKPAVKSEPKSAAKSVAKSAIKKAIKATAKRPAGSVALRAMPAPAGFAALVDTIRRTDMALAAQAVKAVNISLTLRNWFVGCYIAEFEFRGADRARYGDRLLPELAKALGQRKVSNTGMRQLYSYLSFYRAYPNILRTASAKSLSRAVGLVVPSMPTKKLRTVSAISANALSPPAQLLLNSLSYSHFELLVEQADALKRSFYEVETLRGNWSVRELKRQIATQYFERTGLSNSKTTIAAKPTAPSAARPQDPALVIRDPYVFEFLGLQAQECHMLIELKNDAFKHEHLGQLNSYVNYYREHEMSEADAPPIGILLCTAKNQELVKFALAGMTNKLFVSRYQVQLPGKDQITAFLQQALRELAP